MGYRSLSVIIVFLNEGEELESTIQSVLQHSDNDIELIVINDASTDGYEYDLLAEKYDIRYVRNSKRMGVAASRDLGVSLITTPYFLLLDAHMRFYDKKWVGRITNLLNYNSSRILCSQTKVLQKSDTGIVSENLERKNSYGAIIELHESSHYFDAIWATKSVREVNEDKTIPIACILGAGYACSKAYWTRLRGLDGLKQYGSDEPYVSIKAWRDGGGCYLINDVIIGHIYRKAPPYESNHEEVFYNKLLIVHTLINDNRLHKKYVSGLRSSHLFSDACRIAFHNRQFIQELKKYYDKTFVNDFLSIADMPAENVIYQNPIENKDELLQKIAVHLLAHYGDIKDYGLLEGKMGIIIFLFHYSQYSNNNLVKAIAESMLSSLCENLNDELGFKTGLLGIGWGLLYLFIHGFVEGDIDSVLEVVDRKVEEIDISKMKDFNIEDGLGGILLYVNARLFTQSIGLGQNPFSNTYLAALKRITEEVLTYPKQKSNVMDTFVYFYQHITNEQVLEKPSVYDITALKYPISRYNIDEYNLGLNGSANIGLKLIFEKESVKQLHNHKIP
jgi:glycosyltransferase involved in cell wall biosynthesis